MSSLDRTIRAQTEKERVRKEALKYRPVLNFTLVPLAPCISFSQTHTIRKPQTFVTIVAGQGKSVQSFVVHKALITYYSVFFRATFNSLFKEAISGIIELENVTSEAFGLVNHWLYFQDFPATPEEPLSLEILAKVWTAADKFKMPALQNYVSGLLCQLLVGRGSMSQDDGQVYEDKYQDYLACIKHIYFSTPAGEHKLKSLFLDVFHYHQVSYAERIEEFPIAFCQDVVKRLATAIPSSRRTWPQGNKSRFLVEEE
ncbi:hypothetical protein VTL71DRAFT_1332 [Oculimacula yallundae]|uniref:BTB domain-containing protein n=1 Tax=Oculimacula yallundae TaxID=86028 RepID=A0ABR4CCT6_9HELO